MLTTEPIPAVTPQASCDCTDDQLDYEVVYQRPQTLVQTPMHYCPGCAHSLVHKLIMEVVEELGIQEKTIGVAPVGCSVFAYDYMDIDMQEAAHGRACAVATGIRRLMPEHYVFTYQGDGDLAAIGLAETMHAINRGENMLIVFMNNAVYGMTSGQMAPTTLPGMHTTTSPDGRNTNDYGMPLKMAELVAQLPGSLYVARHTVHTANAVRKTRKSILQAFQYQKQYGHGTSFIEILANCPSNWKMTPLETGEFIAGAMSDAFPPGDIKIPTSKK